MRPTWRVLAANDVLMVVVWLALGKLIAIINPRYRDE